MTKKLAETFRSDDVISVYHGFAFLRLGAIGWKTRATFLTNQNYNQNQSWIACASFPAVSNGYV